MATRNPFLEHQKCLNILGLKDGASEDEIRKAYKKLALQYHPDKNNSDDAKAKFQDIGYAYKYLTEGPSAFDNDQRQEMRADILIRLFEDMFFPRYTFGYRSHPFFYSDNETEDEYFYYEDDDDDEYGNNFYGCTNQSTYNSRYGNGKTQNKYTPPERPAQTQHPPSKKQLKKQEKRAKQRARTREKKTQAKTAPSYSDDIRDVPNEGEKREPAESRKTDTQGTTESKRSETPSQVPSQKAKKSKKQLKNEQRKREQEMEKIAAEILEKQEREKEKQKNKENKIKEEQQKTDENEENEEEDYEFLAWYASQMKSRRARKKERQREAGEACEKMSEMSPEPKKVETPPAMQASEATDRFSTDNTVPHPFQFESGSTEYATHIPPTFIPNYARQQPNSQQFTDRQSYGGHMPYRPRPTYGYDRQWRQQYRGDNYQPRADYSSQCFNDNYYDGSYQSNGAPYNVQRGGYPYQPRMGSYSPSDPYAQCNHFDSYHGDMTGGMGFHAYSNTNGYNKRGGNKRSFQEKSKYSSDSLGAKYNSVPTQIFCNNKTDSKIPPKIGEQDDNTDEVNTEEIYADERPELIQSYPEENESETETTGNSTFNFSKSGTSRLDQFDFNGHFTYQGTYDDFLNFDAKSTTKNNGSSGSLDSLDDFNMPKISNQSETAKPFAAPEAPVFADPSRKGQQSSLSGADLSMDGLLNKECLKMPTAMLSDSIKNFYAKK